MTTTDTKIRERLREWGVLSDKGLFGKPIQTDFVSVKVNPTTLQAFEMGLRAAEGTTLGSVNRKDIDSELMSALRKAGIEDPNDDFGSFRWVRAAFEEFGGQTGRGPRNIIIYLIPSYGRDSVYAIQVGCAHEMEGKTLGRCYYRYSCTKCDYTYEVDSSD